MPDALPAARRCVSLPWSRHVASTPLQGAHPPAGECRCAGGQQAVRIPCFTLVPQPNRLGLAWPGQAETALSGSRIASRIALRGNPDPYPLLFPVGHEYPVRDFGHRAPAAAAYIVESGRADGDTGRIGARCGGILHNESLQNDNDRGKSCTGSITIPAAPILRRICC